MPFYNDPISPAMVKDGVSPNEIVRKWAAKIKEADAFVIRKFEDGSLDSFAKSAGAFLDQLIWWARALKNARQGPL